MFSTAHKVTTPLITPLTTRLATPLATPLTTMSSTAHKVKTLIVCRSLGSLSVGLFSKKSYTYMKRANKYMTNCAHAQDERWGAGVETQKNVRGEIWGWGRVPFNEPYAPSLSTIYDGA